MRSIVYMGRLGKGNCSLDYGLNQWCNCFKPPHLCIVVQFNGGLTYINYCLRIFVMTYISWKGHECVVK